MKNFTISLFVFLFSASGIFSQSTIIIGNASTYNGAIVTIPVEFQPESAGTISHYLLQGQLHFDDTKLKFRSVSADQGTLLNDNGWFLVGWADSGTVNFFAFGFNDIASDGNLFNLTFKVIDDTISSADVVGVPEEWLSNGAEGPFGIIGAGEISYTFPVGISEIRGDATLDFDVTFDDVLALLYHLYLNTPLTGAALVNADTDRDLDLDINDMLGMILYIAFGNWNFDFPAIDLGATVAFNGVEVNPNGTLEIPVNVLNSSNVQNGEIIFDYNPEEVTMQSYKSGLEKGFVYANQPQEGKSVFVFANQENKTGSYSAGKVTLRFKGGQVKDNVKISTHYRLNNGELISGPDITLGVTDAKTEPVIPGKFEIAQNFPNPFNPSTTIKFGLPEASFVSIRIYDMLGQLIKTLISEEKNAGTYQLTWNGDNDTGVKVTSGTYIYRITAGNNIQTMKMLMVK